MSNSFYPNIPGTIFAPRDGNMLAPVSAPSTGNITVMDFGLWGPYNEPTDAANLDDVQALNGKVVGQYGDSSRASGFNGNSLVLGVHEAYGAGNRNITTIRLNFGGVPAYTKLLTAVVLGTGSGTNTALGGGTSTITFGTFPTGMAVGVIIRISEAEDVDGGKLFRVTAVDADAKTAAIVPFGATLPTSLAAHSPAGTLQVETATAAGTISGTGTVAVTIIADGMVGSPKTVQVDVLENDSASAWADKVRTALNLEADITDKFTVGGTGVFISLTSKTPAANDTTLNIALADGTSTGVTAAPTSGDTTPGVASGAVAWEFFANQAAVTFNAMWAGALGNSIKWKISSTGEGETLVRTLTIKLPNELGGRTRAYSSSSFTTLGALANRVNKEMANAIKLSLLNNTVASLSMEDGLRNCENDGDDEGFFTVGNLLTPFATAAQVGTDAGLDAVDNTTPMIPSASGVDIAKKLSWYAAALGDPLNADDDQKALSLLSGQPVGIIVIPSLYWDDIVDESGATRLFDENDPNSSLLQYLGNFCHMQRVEGINTEVVFAPSTLADESVSGVRDRYNWLLSAEVLSGEMQNTDGVTDPIDIGRYFSVWAGPDGVIVNRSFGAYRATGATQYAALLTMLPPSAPPTWKMLPGFEHVTWHFTRPQINKLAGPQGINEDGGAYVVGNNITGPLRVNAGVTLAAKKSDFHSKHNDRVAQAVTYAIKKAVQPYIGTAFGYDQYNGMHTAIQTELDKLVDANVLAGGESVGYKFWITQTPTDAILNVVNVVAQAKPVTEVKWVNVDVAMTM